jgi:hypothetical protein
VSGAFGVQRQVREKNSLAEKLRVDEEERVRLGQELENVQRAHEATKADLRLKAGDLEQAKEVLQYMQDGEEEEEDHTPDSVADDRTEDDYTRSEAGNSCFLASGQAVHILAGLTAAKLFDG